MSRESTGLSGPLLSIHPPQPRQPNIQRACLARRRIAAVALGKPAIQRPRRERPRPPHHRQRELGAVLAVLGEPARLLRLRLPRHAQPPPYPDGPPPPSRRPPPPPAPSSGHPDATRCGSSGSPASAPPHTPGTTRCTSYQSASTSSPPLRTRRDRNRTRLSTKSTNLGNGSIRGIRSRHSCQFSVDSSQCARRS